MQLYIRGHYLSSETPQGHVEPVGTHGRITLNYKNMCPKALIALEMKSRKGLTLVSCTSATTQC
jgi:hypothetical protein